MIAITIKAALAEAKSKLETYSETPLLDAEILLSHALNKPRSEYYAWPEKLLDPADYEKLKSFIERRKQGEPIAYITNVREFWSQTLEVNPHTLIPRPETETLIEYLLKHFDKTTALKVADLGTGSGAIAIALASERPLWQIVATDLSAEALAIAKKNAAKSSIHSISFQEGHWLNALSDHDFDVIVSNPPYIAESEWPDYALGLAFEPREALVSGQDGLDAISEIASQARHYLKPGGLLLIEHGFKQGEAIRALLIQQGYQQVDSIMDLSHQERATSGYLPEILV